MVRTSLNTDNVHLPQGSSIVTADFFRTLMWLKNKLTHGCPINQDRCLTLPLSGHPQSLTPSLVFEK